MRAQGPASAVGRTGVSYPSESERKGIATSVGDTAGSCTFYNVGLEGAPEFGPKVSALVVGGTGGSCLPESESQGLVALVGDIAGSCQSANAGCIAFQKELAAANADCEGGRGLRG